MRIFHWTSQSINLSTNLSPFQTLKNPSQRIEYNRSHEIEHTTEMKAESNELFWKTRKEFRDNFAGGNYNRGGRLWSDKLAADLRRSSAIRSMKRRERRAKGLKNEQFLPKHMELQFRHRAMNDLWNERVDLPYLTEHIVDPKERGEYAKRMGLGFGICFAVTYGLYRVAEMTAAADGGAVL